MKPSEALRKMGQAIAYYKGLTPVLGGVTATVLFSQLFYWSDKTNNTLGVYKTLDELCEETGLTKGELRSARKKLCELGVLVETHKRLEHKVYFKIDFDVFDRLMSEFGEVLNVQSAKCKSNTPPNVNLTSREVLDCDFVIDQETTTITTAINTDNNPLPPKPVGEDKKQKFVAEQIELPDWINRDDWIAFCEHRKEIKKPLSERAAKLGISELKKLKDSGENVADVINQTIFNRWAGFFALKRDDGLAKQSTAKEYPGLDCAQVITDFNEILSQRFEPVELNAITREKILSLAAVMKNQTNSAFRGYFAKFNKVASDFYKSGKVGFSFVMKPETMQRVKENAL